MLCAHVIQEGFRAKRSLRLCAFVNDGSNAARTVHATPNRCSRPRKRSCHAKFGTPPFFISLSNSTATCAPSISSITFFSSSCSRTDCSSALPFQRVLFTSPNAPSAPEFLLEHYPQTLWFDGLPHQSFKVHCMFSSAPLEDKLY